MATFTSADRVGSIGGYIGGISALSGMLGNVLGGIGGNCGSCAQGAPVSRYEMDLAMSNNAKDSEIALLKAERYSDQKLVEVYKDLNGQISELAKEVRVNKEEQAAINMQQATYNGVNSATIQCIQNQVTQLLGVTKLVIPNDVLCPGYGTAVVTPPAASTTTPAA